MKWSCDNCKAINPSLSSSCHNCRELPWGKFKLATGLANELNEIVDKLAHEIVQDGGWPSKVFIGEYWLKDFKSRPVSFWLGSFGINAEVEIIPGDLIKVI